MEELWWKCVWMCFVCSRAIAVDTKPINWIQDSVIDVHFIYHLTTLGALTIHNCAAECYARLDCICMGYSESFQQCQLYDRNIGYFSTGLIAQGSTKIYRRIITPYSYPPETECVGLDQSARTAKAGVVDPFTTFRRCHNVGFLTDGSCLAPLAKAACENTEYTFIRELNVCMKLHTTAMNYTTAIFVCSSEDSMILHVDKEMLTHMDKLYPNLGGSHYYVNGRLINDTHVKQSLGILGGSALISPIDSLAWITGEPNTNRTCVALTWDYMSGTTGFQTQACNDDLEFFCGHSV